VSGREQYVREEGEVTLPFRMGDGDEPMNDGVEENGCGHHQYQQA
jgi:hypothetical protein